MLARSASGWTGLRRRLRPSGTIAEGTQDRRSAEGEPVVTDRNRVVGKDVDALDRRLVEVDRHESVVRGKRAPVEIEMDPHLEDRERRRFGCIDDGAAGRVPAAAEKARPLPRKVSEWAPADPPRQSQAARP